MAASLFFLAADVFINRLHSKLALFDKISNFCADLLKNFESMCKHMVEKFYSKGAENGNFSK